MSANVDLHTDGDLRTASKSLADLLRNCSQNKDLCRGIRVHALLAKRGLLEKSPYVLGSSLVNMYAKCGAFAKAHRVLQDLPVRDVITWNALISAYVQLGRGKDALNYFEQMECEGLAPDDFTFSCILRACGSTGAVDIGERIHHRIASRGLLWRNIVLGNALIDMYAKCGAVAKAHKVLHDLPVRDAISWSSLIAGYAQRGQGEEALNCFTQMQCEGLSPDIVTFVCILKACCNIGAADKGKQVHDEIIAQGLLGEGVALASALVDMYVKCNELTKARQVFDELPVRNVYTWSAMIAGYVQNEQGEEALNCFEQMQRDNLSPDAITFACMMKACGSLGAVDKGKQIHHAIIGQGLMGTNVVIGTALVDMYCKFDLLEEAQQMLHELSVRDVVTWSALIAGYAQQGQGKKALEAFEQMINEGLFPNEITFICMLNACCRSGLVDEGNMYLATMGKKYGIQPDIGHHTCMVDLFGRLGHFDKAIAVIKRLQLSDDPTVWCALLGACQRWENLELGKWAFDQAVHSDMNGSEAYVCIAQIYANAGIQEHGRKIEAFIFETNA